MPELWRLGQEVSFDITKAGFWEQYWYWAQNWLGNYIITVLAAFALGIILSAFIRR